MRPPLWKKMREFWGREESLTTFLWLLVIFTFIVAPISELHPRLEIVLDGFFGVVLVAGVLTALESQRLARLALLFVFIAVCTSVLKLLVGPDDDVQLLSELADIPPVLFFLYLIFSQTMRDGPVTSHRVKGAIASYLLIGIVFAKIFIALQLAIPGAFDGIGSGDTILSLVYFSFTTLTTTGYGDIQPVHGLARSAANAESLIGQLFPAIIIARIVTLELEHRRRS